MSAPPPQPTDPIGAFVGDVHVVTEGPADGPVVAMLHGLPGSVRDFRYLGPAVTALGMRAVRIDLPGFGKTPAGAFPSNALADRAVFVQRVLHAMGIERFALAAHSFGGGIATHCAALFPERVLALACINSLGPRRHKGYFAPGVAIRNSTRLLDVPVLGPRWHQLLKSGYAANGLKSENGLDVDVIKLHFAIFGSVDFKELRGAASRVRAPSLIVSSRNDPLVEPACAFAFVRALSQAPVVSHIHVDEGGHFLQKHQAVPVAAWLARTLDVPAASARAA